jgi:uncharacterized protein (DUF934 family)
MLLADDGALRDDDWRHLEDSEAIPDSNPVTVSFARWEKEDKTLRARNGRLGLRLPSDAPVEAIAPALDRLELIVLSFPKFTDGRAYSQARLLRGRYGYKGELRATGEVLRDQLLFMRRCGFDSFTVGQRAIDEDWPKAFADFDTFYQAAADGRDSVMRQRLSRPR